jgi:hypothetical protein
MAAMLRFDVAAIQGINICSLPWHMVVASSNSRDDCNASHPAPVAYTSKNRYMPTLQNENGQDSSFAT